MEVKILKFVLFYKRIISIFQRKGTKIKAFPPLSFGSSANKLVSMQQGYKDNFCKTFRLKKSNNYRGSKREKNTKKTALALILIICLYKEGLHTVRYKSDLDSFFIKNKT